MKVVILAGGFGTRLGEETELKPKPMLEIGGKPILWHIMKIYSHYGYNDFIICLGYKGYIIKEYFANYFLHQFDVSVNLEENKMEFYNHKSDPWKITLVDTGLNTQTGGRIKRVQKFIKDETFMLTYGDGVADIDINKLVECHRKHNKYVVVTAVQPPGRFGSLDLGDDEIVRNFIEKPKGDKSWINGGFFVLKPQVFEYIKGDETPFEAEPLERLSQEGQCVAYKHYGFWMGVDTLRDKRELEKLWATNKAYWKVWSE